MKNEPSPRPWRVAEYPQCPGLADVFDASGSPSGLVAGELKPTDAALIVAAVNERDRLRVLVKRMIPFVEKCHSDALDLSKTIKGICALKGVDTSEIDRINSEHDALIAEARAALGEDAK